MTSNNNKAGRRLAPPKADKSAPASGKTQRGSTAGQGSTSAGKRGSGAGPRGSVAGSRRSKSAIAPVSADAVAPDPMQEPVNVTESASAATKDLHPPLELESHQADIPKHPLDAVPKLLDEENDLIKEATSVGAEREKALGELETLVAESGNDHEVDEASLEKGLKVDTCLDVPTSLTSPCLKDGSLYSLATDEATLSRPTESSTSQRTVGTQITDESAASDWNSLIPRLITRNYIYNACVAIRRNIAHALLLKWVVTGGVIREVQALFMSWHKVSSELIVEKRHACEREHIESKHANECHLIWRMYSERVCELRSIHGRFKIVVATFFEWKGQALEHACVNMQDQERKWGRRKMEFLTCQLSTKGAATVLLCCMRAWHSDVLWHKSNLQHTNELERSKKEQRMAGVAVASVLTNKFTVTHRLLLRCVLAWKCSIEQKINMRLLFEEKLDKQMLSLKASLDERYKIGLEALAKKLPLSEHARLLHVCLVSWRVYTMHSQTMSGRIRSVRSEQEARIENATAQISKCQEDVRTEVVARFAFHAWSSTLHESKLESTLVRYKAKLKLTSGSAKQLVAMMTRAIDQSILLAAIGSWYQRGQRRTLVIARLIGERSMIGYNKVVSGFFTAMDNLRVCLTEWYTQSGLARHRRERASAAMQAQSDLERHRQDSASAARQAQSELERQRQENAIVVRQAQSELERQRQESANAARQARLEWVDRCEALCGIMLQKFVLLSWFSIWIQQFEKYRASVDRVYGDASRWNCKGQHSPDYRSLRGHVINVEEDLRQQWNGTPPAAPRIGARVSVKWDGFLHVGTLRYVGDLLAVGRAGVWAGVELDSPCGKNDGSIGEYRYFKCTPRRGIFVKYTALVEGHSPNAEKESKEVSRRKARSFCMNPTY